MKVSKILGLIFFTLFCGCYTTQLKDNPTLEEYYEYVINYVTGASSFVLPTDNSDLVKTDSGTVYDYGTFDFIIVGGGTAGSLLANRLSQVTSWNILLLEAGAETENAFTDIPAMNYYLRNTSMNWGYFTKPQKNSCLGMIDHKCVYPTGKVLGGSGVLGDMVLARGNKQDFDDWENLGNQGWSYDTMLPYFKKFEQLQIDEYDSGFHGFDGEVKINYTSPTEVNAEQILAATEYLGLKKTDYNGKNQIGISKFQWTVDFNKRLTGGSAFVLSILSSRTNLNLTLGAFVTKVLLDDNVATGVQFIVNGTTYKATASKEVILSAGAINSPQILMLSGIGPKDELENLKISPRIDLPVGKYLTDHPVFVGMYIRTNQTVEERAIIDNLERYMNGQTPYTAVFCAEHIGFLNTKNSRLSVPNLEILTANPPMSVPADTKMFYNLNATYQDLFAEFNTYTDFLIYIINLNPKSRGSVTLASNSPTYFPVIDPAYYTDSNDEDIEVIYDGIQYVLDLLQTESLKSVNATIVFHDTACDYLRASSERDYWLCAIKHFTSTLYHPTGTTKMGSSPKNSVVDNELRVHNTKNLRVVDAGSIPKIVSGHPLAAIWALAEKISDGIKADYNSTLH